MLKQSCLTVAGCLCLEIGEGDVTVSSSSTSLDLLGNDVVVCVG